MIKWLRTRHTHCSLVSFLVLTLYYSFIYMCVCVYKYMYVCVYVCVCVYTHIKVPTISNKNVC